MLKNLPIFNAGGEVNEAGGIQFAFPNPEDGWIPGSRWRDLRLKKDLLEEITEARFCAPTTQEDFRVPPRKKYNFFEVFYNPVFAKNRLCGKRQREIIHEFVWMEEASQGTFPRLALRVGGN